MKYLMLTLLLSGCSLIKINEATPLPKHHPEFIGVTVLDNHDEYQVRIRVSEIISYTELGKTCVLVFHPPMSSATVNNTCAEIDAELRK